MGAALKYLRDQARKEEGEEAKCKNRAAQWRERASQTEAAAAATREYEEAERKLYECRVAIGKDPSPPAAKAMAGMVAKAEDVPKGDLGSRLYASMVKRNLKIGEVRLPSSRLVNACHALARALMFCFCCFDVLQISSVWDKDHSGTIDRKEFRERVSALVLDSDRAEIEALFTKLDYDGDGALDIEELKAALKGLQEAAAASRAEETTLLMEVTRARKIAVLSQVEVRNAMVDEKEELAAREAAEKEANEEKRKEEARRVARREARIEEKRRFAAEEKKAFEERVEAKRKKVPGRLTGGSSGSLQPAVSAAPATASNVTQQL